MPSILDFMSEEDRVKSKAAFKLRMEGKNYTGKVPKEIYMICELAYYYGWGAIESVKRGYIESFDEDTGKRNKILLTLDEVGLLVTGARKVWFSKLIDQARATQIAAGSINAKHPASAFERGIKPFVKASAIDDRV